MDRSLSGCLSWVLLAFVALAWQGFGSGKYLMGIIGAVGILFFRPRTFLVGFRGHPRPPQQRGAAPYRRT
jgi:hypothetical protein